MPANLDSLSAGAPPQRRILPSPATDMSGKDAQPRVSVGRDAGVVLFRTKTMARRVSYLQASCSTSQTGSPPSSEGTRRMEKLFVGRKQAQISREKKVRLDPKTRSVHVSSLPCDFEVRADDDRTSRGRNLKTSPGTHQFEEAAVYFGKFLRPVPLGSVRWTSGPLGTCIMHAPGDHAQHRFAVILFRPFLGRLFSSGEPTVLIAVAWN